MNCPKCYEPLRIAERKGIEIDYCPECRGVWLDAGELDKIIERTIQADFKSSEAYRDYGRSDSSHHTYKPKSGYHKKEHKSYYHKSKHYKKKHVLKEIFDFFD